MGVGLGAGGYRRGVGEVYVLYIFIDWRSGPYRVDVARPASRHPTRQARHQALKALKALKALEVSDFLGLSRIQHALIPKD